MTRNMHRTYQTTVPRRLEMHRIIRTAFERGLTFFDAAEASGPLEVERILGEAAARARDAARAAAVKLFLRATVGNACRCGKRPVFIRLLRLPKRRRGLCSGFKGPGPVDGSSVAPPCRPGACPAGQSCEPTLGDTSDVFEDYQTCSAIGRSDPDLFYRLAPTANGVVTLRLQPNGFDGRLGVLASCQGSCLGRADDGGVGMAEVLSVSLLRSVVYHVVVEGRPDGGTFTLSAQ